MANNCNLKFNTTKVGTNLKAEVGNNDVLFNSLMSAVIDGSRPSGFNAEFESYYKTNYDSVPNVDNDNAEVVEAIKSFYNNKNFKVNEQTTNSAFISDVLKVILVQLQKFVLLEQQVTTCLCFIMMI